MMGRSHYTIAPGSLLEEVDRTTLMSGELLVHQISDSFEICHHIYH